MEVIDWLAQRGALHPDRSAIVDASSGRTLSYAMLHRLVRCAAQRIADLGVQPGERVALLGENSIDALLLLLGASQLGAIFVPLNTRLSTSELAEILADAGPTLLFHDDRSTRHAESLSAPRLVALLNDWGKREWSGRVSLPLDAPQMILYTSGTTGRPKGVVMSHRMVLWNCINLLQRDLLPTDVVLWHLPVYYTGGLHGFTLPALFAGAKVVSVPRWNPGDVFDAIERERVTILFGVPTQLLAMMDSPRMATSDLRSLRYVMSGGAPCPIPLIERFAARGLRFRQALGMTEVGPHCFAQEPDDAFRKPGSVGHPFLSIRHRIVDTEGRDVEPGQVGELWLSSPAMMDGYWNDPDATARAFQDDWFRSGDQVRQDIEGDLYVVGRTKDMLIRGGENVYPAEVESLLHAHPGVLEAAVIGVPHPTWGEVGMALVVRRPDASVSEGDLLAYCRERLARFKVPESAVFVEALPRTASGKVRKADLAALYGVR